MCYPTRIERVTGLEKEYLRRGKAGTGRNLFSIEARKNEFESELLHCRGKESTSIS